MKILQLYCDPDKQHVYAAAIADEDTGTLERVVVAKKANNNTDIKCVCIEQLIPDDKVDEVIALVCLKEYEEIPPHEFHTFSGSGGLLDDECPN